MAHWKDKRTLDDATRTEAAKVHGFVEHLEGIPTRNSVYYGAESRELLALRTVPEKDIGVYLLDCHHWSTEAWEPKGIEMSVIVGAYKGDRHADERFKYRDRKTSARDDSSKYFTEIKGVEVDKDVVYVTVASRELEERVELTLK